VPAARYTQQAVCCASRTLHTAGSLLCQQDATHSRQFVVPAARYSRDRSDVSHGEQRERLPPASGLGHC
jgi:hypothetical protein